MLKIINLFLDIILFVCCAIEILAGTDGEGNYVVVCGLMLLSVLDLLRWINNRAKEKQS